MIDISQKAQSAITKSSRRTSISEIAYSAIRRKILFNDLKGGQAIDESTLARQLDLGRTPVREAVHRLAREGLLRVIPRKGVVVTELSIETLGQIFEVRSSCEVQVARLATVRADSSDIEAMEQALEGVEQMVAEKRFRDLIEADERFHLALAEAARNPLLGDMLSTLYGLGIRFWYVTLPQRQVKEVKQEMALHREIVKAIKAGDPERSAKTMFTIIEGFPDRIVDLVKRDPSKPLFT